MSGIIGGAGSKSGVIGETEIDYEEGDLDATTFFLVGGSPVDISGGTTKIGSYVKIGQTCYISFQINSGSVNLGTGNITLALPFTAHSKSWIRMAAALYEGGGGGWLQAAQIGIDTNGTSASVYRDQLTNAFVASSTNQRMVFFGGTYRVI